MPASRTRGNTTLLEHIESLGIQTFGKERQNPNAVVRRIVLKFQPLIKLYRVELPALFGRLLRDEGTVLDRFDPLLFDDDLDNLLEEFGPLIWPVLGSGNREHLRAPRKGTRYTADLVYPGDNTILKEHLRGIVRCKKARADIDLDGYINKTHHDAKRLLDKEAPIFTHNTAKKRKRDGTVETEDRLTSRRQRHMNSEPSVASDSEDSVLGTKTRRQTRLKDAQSPDGPGMVQLRLYRKTLQVTPPSVGPVRSYGNLMLVTNIETSDDCFTRICEKIEADCSFMIFQLPEDMSMADRVRIDRGSKESETIFQRMLFTIRKARIFPYGPPHRSVEVEIGLDVSDD